MLLLLLLAKAYKKQSTRCYRTAEATEISLHFKILFTQKLNHLNPLSDILKLSWTEKASPHQKLTYREKQSSEQR